MGQAYRYARQENGTVALIISICSKMEAEHIDIERGNSSTEGSSISICLPQHIAMPRTSGFCHQGGQHIDMPQMEGKHIDMLHELKHGQHEKGISICPQEKKKKKKRKKEKEKKRKNKDKGE